MSLIKKIKRSILPPDSSEDQDIFYFRQRILHYLLLSIIIAGGVAYLPSVYFAWRAGLYNIIVLDTLALVFIGVLFLTQRLTYFWKVWCLVAVFFILGLWLLILIGPMGAGFMWLLMFSVMTGVLLGTRPVFISLGMNILSVLVLGILVHLDQFSWATQIPEAFSAFSLWVVLGVNFVCINAVMAISAAILLKKLDTIFDREKNNRLELETEIQNRIQAEKESERLAEQLLHTQKMEAMGTLAGGVAHDFNNILSSILGYSELSMMDLKEDQPVYQNLEKICQSCDRAKAIVHQILTFSRQARSQKINCSILNTVTDCVNLFRIGVPAHIEFVCDIRSEDKAVLADPTQLYQVIMNLCTNAGSAIGEDRGRIDIIFDARTLTEDDYESWILNPGEYAVISVTDSGCGIEKEIINRIFEPYFTTRGVGKGSGMGLAIAHGIIKDHKGEILVSSTPGKGSCFTIYLPVCGAAEPKDPPALNGSLTGHGSLLFVDDEEDLINIGKLYLERLGYAVETESDPVHALEIFRQSPDRFDLVITDKKMPGMTGNELKDQIKEIRPDIPVILCSGFVNTRTDSDFDDILIKPVRNRAMARSIKTILKNR